MSEQDQYDPADHTVDQVNEHLSALSVEDSDGYQAERERILGLEAEANEPRKGILEGPHALGSDDPDPEPDDEPDAPETAAEQRERVQGDGYLGTIADTTGDPNAIKTADQAAPEGADDAPSYIGEVPEKATRVGVAVPVSEQPDPEVEGQRYRDGYFGDLPDADNRPDLTLAGVTKRDYPDAEKGETGEPVQS